nr:hypothetical protein [Tanacetum cinerariifolium]
MSALEDIIYSDDEEDVGLKANFSNLDTSITVSPIPTTRVHKDYPITQIISDLPSGTRESTPSTQRSYLDRSYAGVASSIQDAKGTYSGGSIDYKEVFALDARIEAIRLFFSLCFLHGLYGFKDPDYPDRVYKVVKALYGLHQAPSAWYETLANYLLENGFRRGNIDQTLFIKKQKVKKKDNGMFISQNKYVAKILRKSGLTYGKSASTPIDTKKPLLKDPDDIMFAVCACAYFQVTPKVSHLHVVQRIFRYLKGKPHLSLWYLKDSPFKLVAYSDSDYVGESLDRKSTTGGCQFLGFDQIVDFLNTHMIQYALMVNPTIYVSCIKQFWTSVSIKKSNDVVRLQALTDRKKVIIIEDTIRQALRLDDAAGVDCLPNEEIFAELASIVYKKPSIKLTFCKVFFLTQ